MVRAEIQANSTGLPTCILTNRSTWHFQSVPSEHRQSQTFIRVANVPGHTTNSRKFDLKGLRPYRVCCPDSMGPNRRAGKVSKTLRN